MTKRLALLVLFVAALAVAGGYASAFLPGGAPRWASWAFAIAIPAMMVAFMALGAARDGERALGTGLRLAFAATFLILASGFGIALALPPADPADPSLWLGLPPRAAIILYGVGLLPMLVLPVAYARTFDAATIRPDALERLRADLAAARAERGVTAPDAAALGDTRAARTERV